MKRFSIVFVLLGIVALALLAPQVLAAPGDNNPCDEPGEKPDVILGDIPDKQRYGASGGITAFSIGTESCNIGTCWATWVSGGQGHPVIGSNMFRLKDGRFEHIGQSWLKHGFATFDDPLCEPPPAGNGEASGSCYPAGGNHLGVNCSDLYWAGLNGSQSNLGPKSEVNPETGAHDHPYTGQGQTGNSIYKRLQVKDIDLNPALNPNSQYFVEGQYVTYDDAQAGNNFNNGSWREIVVSGTSTFDFSYTGPTVIREAAINAWQQNDTGVALKSLINKAIGGAKVTDNLDGTWTYEYAVQNVIYEPAIGEFRVAIPHNANITNIGFHDVDYHSGEPYSGTDWAVTIDTVSSPNVIKWASKTFAEDPNANALRWGTLYNFRFTIDVPPVNGLAFLQSFNPNNQQLKWPTSLPARCGDAFCDNDENVNSCAADCAIAPDAGEVPDGDDLPGDMLLLVAEPNGDITLDWDVSCVAGDSDYAIYHGPIGDFSNHTAETCTTGGVTNRTITPAAGSLYYLVVPNNGLREGSYGSESNGDPRTQNGAACFSQAIGTCF